MSAEPYIVEMAMLLLVAFVLGGLFGFWARHRFVPHQDVKPDVDPVPDPMTDTPAATPDDDGKPAMLNEARDGLADDLKKISGIGPKIETTLHQLGVFHFDQIAAWDETAIGWVDNKLSFHGRIAREDWVGQARALVDKNKP